MYILDILFPSRLMRSQGEHADVWLREHGQAYLDRWRVITVLSAALGAWASYRDSGWLFVLSLLPLLGGAWMCSYLKGLLRRAADDQQTP